MHHGPLIAIIVMGLGLAFVFGALAQKFRVSPLVGYLLAGVAVGPFRSEERRVGKGCRSRVSPDH